MLPSVRSLGIPLGDVMCFLFYLISLRGEEQTKWGQKTGEAHRDVEGGMSFLWASNLRHTFFSDGC